MVVRARLRGRFFVFDFKFDLVGVGHGAVPILSKVANLLHHQRLNADFGTRLLFKGKVKGGRKRGLVEENMKSRR